MNVGRWMVALGAALLAMSVALFSSLSSRAPIAEATTFDGIDGELLSIGWSLACLPYPAESAPATSHAQAFGCRNDQP